MQDLPAAGRTGAAEVNRELVEADDRTPTEQPPVIGA